LEQTTTNRFVSRLKESKLEAVESAIDALSRYKFMMFGYWAAIWVHLNNLDSQKETNPFREFVELARRKQATINSDMSSL